MAGLLRILLCLMLALSPAWPVAAADSIGATRQVVHTVTGEIERSLRKLIVGDPVHLNETIKTEPRASTHIVLDDDTSLSLGSNTTLVLDEFVYAPTRSTGEIVFSTARGALRFISGKASKDSYRLNTPMATVGIRGTDFDSFVDRFGTTLILLRDGIVRLCRAAVVDIWADTPDCIDIVAPFTWGLVNYRGVIGPFPWDGSSISDILFANRPGIVSRDSEDDDSDPPMENPQEHEEEVEMIKNPSPS